MDMEQTFREIGDMMVTHKSTKMMVLFTESWISVTMLASLSNTKEEYRLLVSWWDEKRVGCNMVHGLGGERQQQQQKIISWDGRRGCTRRDAALPRG